MKKFITLILLINFISIYSCQSFQTFLGYPSNDTGEEIPIKPDNFEGCKKYNSRKRLECNNLLIFQLEKIKNSSFRRKIIETKRIDKLHIKQLISACSVETSNNKSNGKELHCWKYWTKSIYKPSFWYKLGRQVLIFGIGILVGGVIITI